MSIFSTSSSFASLSSPFTFPSLYKPSLRAPSPDRLPFALWCLTSDCLFCGLFLLFRVTLRLPRSILITHLSRFTPFVSLTRSLGPHYSQDRTDVFILRERLYFATGFSLIQCVKGLMSYEDEVRRR